MRRETFLLELEDGIDHVRGPGDAHWRTTLTRVARQRTLNASRFDLKFGIPGLTHDQVMSTIELYGDRVILPRVRELLEA